MPGPTAFTQIQNVVNVGTQTIPTTAETVIATLSNINSRGANYPINITGSAVFAIAAATTATVMRIRIGSVTGTLLGAGQIVSGGVAGDVNAGDGTIGAVYTPSLEVAGLVLVLTIQATAAGSNWNVTFASLTAQQ
jgi:hypothetical protein